MLLPSVCLSCLKPKFGQLFCAPFLDSGVREADEQQETKFDPTFYVLYQLEENGTYENFNVRVDFKSTYSFLERRLLI